VAEGLILETTFLVDLERELVSAAVGPAQRFLETNSSQSLFISFTIAGELAAGVALEDRSSWDRLIAPFPVLPATTEVCWRYGATYRYLRTNGLLIAANDLWIAATALAFDKTVVTRNVRDYQRVPGLTVRSY
jgi:tRNA(fMet)-specific endonuclease VapC